MRGIPFLLSSCILATLAPAAFAGLGATTTIKLDSTTGTAADPIYNYTINLHNSGTTTIGTFWYAWVPGLDYLPSQPTITSSPSGWLGYVAGGGPPYDGYSIEWYSYFVNPTAPGGNLSFSFSTADSPAVLAAHSPIAPGVPVQTSFLYQGDPQADPGLQITLPAPTVSVPEPASLTILTLGILGLTVRKPRRR